MQQKSTSPPAVTLSYLLQLLEFTSTDAGNVTGDPSSSSLFDWFDFLDFDLDDNINIAFDPHAVHRPESESGPNINPVQPQSQQSQQFNQGEEEGPEIGLLEFFGGAGRVPCACPKSDQKLEEEVSRDLPGKKRVRTARILDGSTARCQVPECEADISELKWYHRRHRICLWCATASAVVLDDSILLSSQIVEPETLLESGHVLPINSDSILLSSQIVESETLLESGHVSTINSGQSDSFVSFAASGEIHVDGKKENPKHKYFPSCENKIPFSIACPAGRISFKLYDWNPADFPRRLWHQIFESLAHMPVELDGYVRPGCTILTAFLAMPKLMWFKVLEEPAKCILELLASPGNMLSGRMHVYLDNKIFLVIKDDCVEEVKVKERAPKLHSII